MASPIPDCAPLDYGIWGEVERKACATPHSSKAALIAKVDEEWANMSMVFMTRVCRAFRPHVEAMLEAKGGTLKNEKVGSPKISV